MSARSPKVARNLRTKRPDLNTMTRAYFIEALARFAAQGQSAMAFAANRASDGGERSGLAVVAAGAMLSACAALPATGPKSDAVLASATAGLRSTNALPYALVDVSADTIGFLSQPNLISFQGQFPDKRPKPEQVAGVGDVLNVSIFEAAPGGLFTPATAAGARPGNFVDLPAQAIDQKGNIYVPYAGEIPSAGRTLPDIQQAIVARLRNRAIEPQVVGSLNQQHSSVVSVLGDVNTPGVLALNSVGEPLLAQAARSLKPSKATSRCSVTASGVRCCSAAWCTTRARTSSFDRTT